jgi:hypothetical protein
MYDLKDALMNLFQEEGCYPPHPLTSLSGKRIAVDCRFLTTHMLKSSSCRSLYDGIRLLSSYLNQNDIHYTVVFGGIDLLDQRHFQSCSKSLSKFLEKNYFVRLMKKNLLESSLLTSGAVNSFSLYSTVAKDTVASSVFQRAFEDQLLAGFKDFGIESIKSPQLRECQLSYLLQTKRVDVVMSSPLAFVLTDSDILAGDINFEDDHYNVFNLQLFAQKYGIEANDMRKCLFAAYIYFLLRDSKTQEAKLMQAIHQTQTTFSTALDTANRRNTESIREFIRSMVKIVPTFSIDWKFCHFLSEYLAVSIQEIFKASNLLFNSPVFTNENRVTNFPHPGFPFSGENLIDVSLTSMTFWFCKQYLDHHFFKLFNKCTNYTYFVGFPRLDILEMRFILKVYLKAKLEESLGYALRTINLEKNIVFRLDLFGEESVVLRPVKKMQDFYCLLPGKPSASPDFSLHGAIMTFGEALKNRQSLQSFRTDQHVDICGVVRMLNLNFLADLGYIDLGRKAIKALGYAFLKSGSSDLDEELIIAFECIRCLLIHKTEYKIDRIESETLRKEIFAQFGSHLRRASRNVNSTKTATALPEPSDDPRSVVTALFAELSFDSFSETQKDPMVGLLIQMSQYDIEKIKVETLISTPYNVIKNFEIEYIRFYSSQEVRNRVFWILKNAFRDGGFERVLFLGRILFFVPGSNTQNEVFDADFNQLKHMFMVIQKALRGLIKASFRMFAFRVAREHDSEFIEAVLDKLPFQKQKSSHLSSLIKIMLQKYLIYKSLEEAQDSFAVVYRQRLEPRKVKAKINAQFNLNEYLDKAVRFYHKIWDFSNNLKTLNPDLDVNGISEHLEDCWPTLDGFVQFCKSAGDD